MANSKIENQNLFTDLDENSAELVSGGAVNIKNTLDRQVKFYYGGSNHQLQVGTLQAGETLTLDHKSVAIFDDVFDDHKNTFAWKTLDHGHYEFGLNHHKVVLNPGNGGSGQGTLNEEPWQQ